MDNNKQTDCRSEFTFQSWEFHVGQNRLFDRQTEEAFELEHKVSSLLLYFCRHPNELCKKDDLFAALWPDRIVNDDSLNVAISKLRKVLADSARAPTFIKTVPGQGYIFLPEVTTSTSAPPPVDPGTWHFSRHLLFGLIALLLAIPLWLFWPSSPLFDGATTTSMLSPTQQADYFKAKQAMESGGNEQRLQAIRSAQRLISEQPEFAEAYLLLLRAKYNHVIRNHVDDLALYREEFVALADKALELDFANGRTHMMRARLAMFLEWDFQKAAYHYRLAQQSTDGDFLVTQDLAEFMFFLGRKSEGLALLQTLRQQKPELYNSPLIPYMYLIAGEDKRAHGEIKAQLNSQQPTEQHWVIAERIGLQVGDRQLAKKAFFSLLPLRGFSAEEIERFRALHDEGGFKRVFSELLEDQDPRLVGQYHPPLSWARYALLSDQPGKALPWLEQAYQSRYVGVLWMDVDPLYSALDSDPVYRDLQEDLQKRRDQVSDF